MSLPLWMQNSASPNAFLALRRHRCLALDQSLRGISGEASKLTTLLILPAPTTFLFVFVLLLFYFLFTQSSYCSNLQRWLTDIHSSYVIPIKLLQTQVMFRKFPAIFMPYCFIYLINANVNIHQVQGDCAAEREKARPVTARMIGGCSSGNTVILI